MKPYRKPKTKKIDPATLKKGVGSSQKKPTLANIFINKVASSFVPLTKFQAILCYRGLKKKPSAFTRWVQRNPATVSIVEKILFVAFIIFALFTNAYLLFILPAIGAMVFYRHRVQWFWWKVKVFILYRNFYEHRRNLYKMGTLYYHLKDKRPRKYENAIIWGQSESIQLSIYRRLLKENKLQTKEYIKL